jgi:hypothetical protein
MPTLYPFRYRSVVNHGRRKTMSAYHLLHHVVSQHSNKLPAWYRCHQLLAGLLALSLTVLPPPASALFGAGDMVFSVPPASLRFYTVAYCTPSCPDSFAHR